MSGELATHRGGRLSLRAAAGGAAALRAPGDGGAGPPRPRRALLLGAADDAAHAALLALVDVDLLLLGRERGHVLLLRGLGTSSREHLNVHGGPVQPLLPLQPGVAAGHDQVRCSTRLSRAKDKSVLTTWNLDNTDYRVQY